MRSVGILVAIAVLSTGNTALSESKITWTDSIGQGTELCVRDLFAGDDGVGGPTLHFWVGDEAAWDSCRIKIDQGELERRGADGWIRLNSEVEKFINSPPWYAFLVRANDGTVVDVEEVNYPAAPSQLVPGAPGKPARAGGY